MNLIPPTISGLAKSKKGVTFYTILAILVFYKQLGLATEMVWPVVACFCAWTLSCGMADWGTGKPIAEDGE